VTLKSR